GTGLALRACQDGYARPLLLPANGRAAMGEFWIFCFPRQAEMGEGAWPPQRLMLYEKCVEPFKALDELRMGIHRENPRGWLNAARRQDDGRSSRLPMFTYRISVQEAK